MSTSTLAPGTGTKRPLHLRRRQAGARCRGPMAVLPLLAAAVLLQIAWSTATATDAFDVALAAPGEPARAPIEQRLSPARPQLPVAVPAWRLGASPAAALLRDTALPALAAADGVPPGAGLGLASASPVLLPPAEDAPPLPRDPPRRFADFFGGSASDAPALRSGLHRVDLQPAASVYVEFGNEDKGVFKGASRSAFGEDASDGGLSMSFFAAYVWPRGDDERLSLSVEQHVFTPAGENKRAPSAVDGDRPFAAYLGGGFGYALRDGPWVHRLDLRLAIVGQMAGGGDLQNLLHGASGKALTVWDDQIAPRAGVIAEYRPALRLRTRCRALCAEFAPHLALLQGNLIAYEGLGATLRLGNRLDRDFGPPVFSPLARGPFVTDHRGFTWSVFAGEERRLQHRNYLLEGPTAASGRRTVDMLRRAGDRQFGADLRLARTTFSVVLVRRAAEFEGQLAQQFVRVGIGGSY